MDSQIISDGGAGAPISPIPAVPRRAAAPRWLRRPRRAGALALALVVLLVAGGLLAGLAHPAAEAVPAGIAHTSDARAQFGLPAQPGAITGSASRAANAAVTVAAAAPDGTSAAAGATAARSPWDNKIIRTAALDLVVADVEAGLATVRDIATGAQGTVFSSSSQVQGDAQVATVTIQVPAESFDSVMTRLRKVGVKVLSENTTSQDVTEEYTDLSSQLKNWQAQQDQLRLLMSRASTVAETLEVQRELSTVNGQIEQAQGRLNYLSHRSALSTITVSLQPKPLTAPLAAPPGWQPADTAARAWDASLAVLARAADAVILVAVFCWWLVPLGLLGLLLVRTLRRPGLVG